MVGKLACLSNDHNDYPNAITYYKRLLLYYQSKHMIINSEILYVSDKLCDLYFITGSLDKGLDLLENKFEALQVSKQSYSKTYIFFILLF